MKKFYISREHPLLRTGFRYVSKRLRPSSLVSFLPITVLQRDDIIHRFSEDENIWFLDEYSEKSPRPIDELIPLSYSEDDSQFLKTKQFTYPEPFVCEFRSARLLGPSGIGVTAKGEVIKTTVSTAGNNSETGGIRLALSTYPLTAVQTFFPNRLLGSSEHEQRDIAMSFHRTSDIHYYSWNMIELLKLRYIEKYIDMKGMRPTIVLPTDPPSYATESLSLLGYSDDDYIEWDGPALDVDRLVVPSLPEPSPSNLEWIRSRMTDAVRKQPETGRNWSEYVYFSREKTGRRKVANESEVVDTLETLGFHRYFGEKMSFQDQVDLFSTASVVVSPHGAGLSNIVWGNRFICD